MTSLTVNLSLKFPVLFLGVALAAGGCSSGGSPQVYVVAPSAGLAVVNSDFVSTSVSLIDPTTRALIHDDCVDSQTVPSDVSLTLSGDVVLPSQQQPGNEVVLIDGTNSALTWVNPQTCVIRQQLRVSPSTFESFPHDVIPLADDKVYVTRYKRNADPAAVPAQQGDDLLIVNPHATPAPIVTGRIDLAPFATPMADVTIEAHPDHGLLADGKVYVSLGNQSADYSASSPGRIVIVDPATDSVTGTIDIPGLKGCSRLDYLAASRTLFVACGGSFSDADQTAGSGLAVIDLGVSPPVVKTTVTGTTVGGTVNFIWTQALADNLALVGTLGTVDYATSTQLTPDALYAIDPVAGTAAKVLEAGAFDLGRAAADLATRTLFLPDGKATGPLVHVIDAAASPPAPVADLDANPTNHLPPREIGWY